MVCWKLFELVNVAGMVNLGFNEGIFNVFAFHLFFGVLSDGGFQVCFVWLNSDFGFIFYFFVF